MKTKTLFERAVVEAIHRLLDLGVPEVLLWNKDFRRQLLDGKVCVVKKMVDAKLSETYFVERP